MKPTDRHYRAGLASRLVNHYYEGGMPTELEKLIEECTPERLAVIQALANLSPEDLVWAREVLSATQKEAERLNALAKEAARDQD